MNGFCILSMKYQETVERQLEDMRREKLYRSCLRCLHRCSSHCLHYIQNNGCTFDLRLAGTNRGSNLQTAATQKPHVRSEHKKLVHFWWEDRNVLYTRVYSSPYSKSHRQLYQTKSPRFPIHNNTMTSKDDFRSVSKHEKYYIPGGDLYISVSLLFNVVFKSLFICCLIFFLFSLFSI